MDQCLQSEERLELLANFITVIESILTSNPVCISHVSGAYDRTQKSLLSILLHGINEPQKYDQLWEFILGLRVIKPNLWPTELFKPLDQDSASLVLLWLKLTMKTQKLSLHMQALISDRERMENYYEKEAFLRSEKLTSSLITSLLAFDQNSQHILAKIDHNLMAQFVLKKSLSADIQYDFCTSPPPFQDRTVVSCSSSPVESGAFTTCFPSYKQSSPTGFTATRHNPFSDTNLSAIKAREFASPKHVTGLVEEQSLDACHLPSNLYTAADTYEGGLSPSTESGFDAMYNSVTENWLLKPAPFVVRHLTKSHRVPFDTDKYRIDANKNGHGTYSDTEPQRLTSRACHVRSVSEGGKRTPRHLSVPLGASDIARNTQIAGSVDAMSVHRLNSSKRFMEDGGHSIEAGACGFFPRPRPGQHLFDFLNDCCTATTNAQLDRENAHFSIAEAVIGAIEQMNYDAQMQEECKPISSCDDYGQPASRTKVRRPKRALTRKCQDQLCPSDEPTARNHSNTSYADSSDLSDCEFVSEVTPSEITAVLLESNQESLTHHSASAEKVAISLLQHYNSKLLPKAIDLQWRFSEEDDLAKKPVCSSGSIASEEKFDDVGNTSIRGTEEWAPPRPQLVLTIHKKPNRTSCITAQKWRCAGCGLKVSTKMSSFFRFCTYLGKYFCTSCHANKRSVIPACAIFNWDFSKYAVSNFSSELLERMQPDPLFNIASLNVGLYKQTQALNQCHVYRIQLFHARKYVVTCRKAKKQNELLESVPLHWSTEPHVYSMDDLIAVKSGGLLDQMMQLTSVLVKHISTCQVCLGQGFICELCKKGKPIFPFQLDAVTQCAKCKACYHLQCFVPHPSCARCLRRDRKHKGSLPQVTFTSSQ